MKILYLFIFLFLLLSCRKEIDYKGIEVSEPNVQTVMASNVNKTQAVLIGDVLNDGNDPTTVRGICWGENSQPTVEDNYTSFGYGSGAFKISVEDLKSGTEYFFRAYAVNEAGDSYGNALSFTTTQKEVGDSLEGGIIAYIFQPGDDGYVADEFHGFIIDASSINTAIWGCEGTSMNTSDLLGAGDDNTNFIFSNCFAPNFAAKSCSQYNGGGYNDWVLPSLNELEEVINNKQQIGVNLSGAFWSSSERDINTAHTVNATNNTLGFIDKNNTGKFFPIRYF